MATCRNIIFESPEIVEKVQQWRNRDDIRCWMIDNHIISQEDHRKWLERLRASAVDSSQKVTSKVYVIYDDISDKPVGVVNLQGINWIHLTAVWGIYIAEYLEEPGVARKALQFIMEMAFDMMGLKKLNSTVFGNNKRALIFNQACGMKPQGVFKDEIQFDSLQRVDLYSFGLTRQEWEKIR